MFPESGTVVVIDFSIIIPTYNRTKDLTRCLESLLEMDYPKSDFEVVIIDDGGDVDLNSLVAKFSKALNIQFYHQKNAGPATARNRGLKMARGKFVAFTDDDCTPGPDWLSRFKLHLDKEPCSAFAGHVINGLPDNIYSTASQLLVDYLCDYFNSSHDGQNFGTSNNLAFSRDSLLKIGGFDESFPLSAAEDRELIERWTSSSQHFRFIPDVVVTHYHAMNLKTYSRQHTNYGRGAFHYHRVRNRRTSDPVKPEPLSFYTAMLSYPFRRGHNMFDGCRMSLLIAWSQFVLVIGFFREKVLHSSEHS